MFEDKQKFDGRRKVGGLVAIGVGIMVAFTAAVGAKGQTSEPLPWVVFAVIVGLLVMVLAVRRRRSLRRMIQC